MDLEKKRAEIRRVDTIRRRANPVQNHIIDEYQAGKITRRQFIRRGAIVGMSLPMLSFIATACAPDEVVETTPPDVDVTPAAPVVEMDTIRAGFLTLGGPLDPWEINDEPRLALIGQTAEYLIFSDPELNPRPALAESWESNEAGDVWTFFLNPDATYHDGTPVTAADVVASFRAIHDGNAASAFDTFGATADGVEAVDDHTVQFTLERPSAAFPFFVSSDNYNAVILPEEFWRAWEEDPTHYEADFPGTGPWLMENFQPGVSATFVKNPDYWAGNPRQAERLEVSFFAEEAPMVLAFQEGRIDMIVPNLSFAGGRVLLDDPDAVVTSIPTAQHRQIYFDTSKPPFQDPRVRQAIALTFDRPAWVEALMGGFAVLGNDHPIWEFYPMFDPGAVQQREQNLAEAQQLLEAAGGGFDSRLDTLVFREIEDLATLVQDAMSQIGINVSVNVTDDTTYYGDFWLAADASMGIVNYGHRGVPDVYLGAPLLSDGTWNASHWVNEEYDQLFAQFTGAVDLDVQRQIAGQIQALLWEEVPFAVPYFLDNLAVTRQGIEGLEVTGMGHVNLREVGLAG